MNIKDISFKPRFALVTEVKGRKIYLGKHIENTILREFPFRSAVLWKENAIGFDIRLLEYAKENKVKGFVFTDSLRKESFKIGIKSMMNNHWIKTENETEGEQVYINRDLLKKTKYYKYPFIKNELYL